MHDKKIVLIPTSLDPIAKELLESNSHYEVIQDSTEDISVLAKKYPNTFALIVRSEKVTAELMDRFAALKVIVRAGTGYNTIDTQYARKKGIDVMNTPGANANAVAELVISMILADARHILAADQSTREGKWEKKKFMGTEISNKVLGIIGLGAIGQLVARRVQGFEMKLLGYDPLISADRERELDIEMVDLPHLFSKSDYITLHIPENAQTKNLIDYALLSLMKPNATLINCARSGVLNEDDFQLANQEKGIRLLNDVYPKDVPGEKSLKDVAPILLPHLGANTKEANHNAAQLAAQRLIEFDEKGITSYIVNRDIPEGLDEAFGELAFTLSQLCRKLGGKESKLCMIETSIYGKLQPFSQWLLIPIVAALSKDFDRSKDFNAACQYLLEMGITYQNRETDSSKKFDNSITLDLVVSVDQGHLLRSSIRGTVAEGTLMISRINDYDKLYFEPKGHTLFFTYHDRPGVLGHIGAKLSENNINIDDVRNPHDTKGEQSIAILKVNCEVKEPLIEDIKKDINAHVGFYINL